MKRIYTTVIFGFTRARIENRKSQEEIRIKTKLTDHLTNPSFLASVS